MGFREVDTYGKFYNVIGLSWKFFIVHCDVIGMTAVMPTFRKIVSFQNIWDKKS